jgi:hypothetical protein
VHDITLFMIRTMLYICITSWTHSFCEMKIYVHSFAPSHSSSLTPENHSPPLQLYELLILDIMYKWIYSVFGLLWLIYFTYHNVLKVHLCSHTQQNSLLLKAESYSYVSIYLIFFTRSFINIYLGCFYILVIVSSIAVFSELEMCLIISVHLTKFPHFYSFNCTNQQVLYTQ